MDKLNICFVGVGSIAKRHIKNLKKICADQGIGLNIDAVRKISPNSVEDISDDINMIYTDFDQIGTVYDVIFITNPTELHLRSLKKAMPYGEHFFIEKPVCSVPQLAEIKELKLKQDAIYYVACPLRYSAVIQYIQNHVNIGDIISVRSISSSYLPDWRPGVDYRASYSAHRSLGGGVAVDLVHEWDYLMFLLGKPDEVRFMSGKKSNLEIDSDDYAIYIAEYEDKIVELHLDYFGRKTIREMMVLTTEETIRCDIENNRVCFLMSGKEIDFEEKRDDFQIRELEYFLNMVQGKIPKENGIWRAIDVLKLTQGVV